MLGLWNFGLSLTIASEQSSCDFASMDGNDYTSLIETGSVIQSSTPEPLPVDATTVPEKDSMAVVGTLIGIIVLLTCLFLYLIASPAIARLRSFLPESKKRVDSRYETIEGWLITKVRTV